MIYYRTCKLCGKEFRINGEINLRYSFFNHIEKEHREEYLKLSNLRHKVIQTRENVKNYERQLGF